MTDLTEPIHALWDELAAFEASQADAALDHLLASVAAMIGAENAYWFGAVRLAEAEADPLLGRRPRSIRYLKPLPDDSTFTRDRIRDIDRGTFDEATVAHARQAGSYRASRLCDLVSPEWFESHWYKGYVGRGVYDSLVVCVPVAAGAEGYYGFLRMRPDDPFTEVDRKTAYYAMRGLPWFHRQVMLARAFTPTCAMSCGNLA